MNSSKNKGKLIIWFVIFLVVFSLVLKSGFLKNFNIVFRPMVKVSSFFSYHIKEKAQIFFSIGSLKKENQSLLEENIRLKSENVKLKLAERENVEFKRQLELPASVEKPLEAVQILGYDLGGNRDLVHINKGSNRGIDKGMAVVAEKRILIGRVKEIFNDFSVVEMINSNSIKVRVEIMENGAKGIVYGQFGTSVVVDMIPEVFELNKGYSVVTSSGEGDSYIPGGLLVGEVKEVSGDKSTPFKKGTVELPVSLEKLNLVWVVKK